MTDSHHFLLFLGAAVVLAITPGPGIFYVLARSLAGERLEGIHSFIPQFIVAGRGHVFLQFITRRDFGVTEHDRGPSGRVHGCAPRAPTEEQRAVSPASTSGFGSGDDRAWGLRRIGGFKVRNDVKDFSFFYLDANCCSCAIVF